MQKTCHQHLNNNFKVTTRSLEMLQIYVNSLQETITLGWKIDLASRINGEIVEWQVFIGPPNIEYPTYSPTIKHDYFNIQPNTETFITFSIEHHTILAKRGFFQPKEYCSETVTLEESVNCYKKCYLQKSNVIRTKLYIS